MWTENSFPTTSPLGDKNTILSAIFYWKVGLGALGHGCVIVQKSHTCTSNQCTNTNNSQYKYLSLMLQKDKE